VDYVPVVESKTMDTSADTVIAHTPTITSTTVMSVWRREHMSKMKEYQLDQYEQEITPEIDDLIKMKEEEEGNE
jgi:hypothetical protein